MISLQNEADIYPTKLHDVLALNIDITLNIRQDIRPDFGTFVHFNYRFPLKVFSERERNLFIMTASYESLSFPNSKSFTSSIPDSR